MKMNDKMVKLIIDIVTVVMLISVLELINRL